jgi:hypothetical protein
MKYAIKYLDKIISHLKAREKQLEEIINGKPLTEAFNIGYEITNLLHTKTDKTGNKLTASKALQKIEELEKKERKLKWICKKDIGKLIDESFMIKDEIEQCEMLKYRLQLMSHEQEEYNRFYSNTENKSLNQEQAGEGFKTIPPRNK